MSEKSRDEFDFPSYASSLKNTPWGMLGKIEEEMKDVSSVSTDDPMRHFRQTAYLRKLARLKSFVETGKLPENMTPKEREGYNLLRECLVGTV